MKKWYTIPNGLNRNQAFEGRKYALKKLIEFRRYPLELMLDKLLIDKTTGKQIIWATDGYSEYGEKYCDRYEISPAALIGMNPVLIQPRAFKALETQQQRTKSKAEVFTPSWIVNKMVNNLDEEWFGRSGVFNIEEGQSWQTQTEKIEFSGKKWKDYVDRSVLEITCGEAPFIVSRYNASTGEIIPIEDRIGILDRKLRVVTEHTDNEDDWIKWTKRAYESIYGYEFQGDNLLIGRANLLLTFTDYYQNVWNKEADKSLLSAITNIITWNFWQMDGLNGTVPLGAPQPMFEQMTLFDFEDKPEEKAPLCKVRKWRMKKTILYKKVEEKEGNDMGKKKWDIVIGNPPYQLSVGNQTTQATPIYHKFVEEAEKIGNKVEMIIPTRWFAGGMGLNSFRDDMKTKNIPYLDIFSNAKECFPSSSISGGVCYFMIDKTNIPTTTLITNHSNGLQNAMYRSLNEFDTIVRDNEAVKIIRKVKETNLRSVQHLISAISPFGLSTKERGHNEKRSGDLALFSSKGRSYIDRDAIKKNLDLVDQYKVLISQTSSEHAGEPDKSGMFKVLTNTLKVIGPEEVCTHSYIVANFNDEIEAQNFMRFLKTKFARFLLLQSLTSIHISKSTFSFVPAVDFHKNWSDDLLYKEFGLDRDEINLIETTIKEME